MTDETDWSVPPEAEPNPRNYEFDLETALTSVVALRSVVADDAFTAETLGTERSGNAVVIDKTGIVLTVGYLVMEAEEIWLRTHDGRAVAGHLIGFDQETGFALVQALGRLDLPALPLGDSARIDVGMRVIAAGAGGRSHSVAAFIAGKQEFAGYWEYVLDEAIFTVPAHPFWGGTGLIDAQGKLIGIGSLQLQQSREDGTGVPLNMYIPIDILKPILQDMLATGTPNRPSRPWLGLYATENESRVMVAGLAGRGPAARSDLKRGDVILSVGGAQVSGLAPLFRTIWSMGKAGVEIPLTVLRDGEKRELRIKSGDRANFLKAPRLH